MIALIAARNVLVALNVNLYFRYETAKLIAICAPWNAWITFKWVVGWRVALQFIAVFTPKQVRVARHKYLYFRDETLQLVAFVFTSFFA